MRDLGNDTAGTAGAAATLAPSIDEIAAFAHRLALEPKAIDDAQRIDRLAVLETLRGATEAAQSETTADFITSQRARAAQRGRSDGRRDRGLAAQVALARRESPRNGARDVALAMLLRRGELPHTRAAFLAGRIDRFKTSLIARETSHLSAEHRAEVDQQIAAAPAGPDGVEALSVRQLLGRLAKAAATLDPAAVALRRRRAEADRHTTLRPAPDVMSWFGALLPVKDGVAVHATLDREARAARTAGDTRTLGQLMADLLVQRVVHPGIATDRIGVSPVPVMVNLLVPDTVLFGDADDVGHVDGYGPVPGDLIREWIADTLDHTDGDDVTAWLRRVYHQPATGRLVTMDSTARFFPPKLAQFLRLRDRWCRNPYCGARIRHADHAIRRADGGATDERNGQSLCELCNYAKEGDGWTARPRPGPRNTIETTTPTGHTYTSTAEPP